MALGAGEAAADTTAATNEHVGGGDDCGVDGRHEDALTELVPFLLEPFPVLSATGGLGDEALGPVAGPLDGPSGGVSETAEESRHGLAGRVIVKVLLRLVPDVVVLMLEILEHQVVFGDGRRHRGGRVVPLPKVGRGGGLFDGRVPRHRRRGVQALWPGWRVGHRGVLVAWVPRHVVEGPPLVAVPVGVNPPGKPNVDRLRGEVEDAWPPIGIIHPDPIWRQGCPYVPHVLLLDHAVGLDFCEA